MQNKENYRIRALYMLLKKYLSRRYQQHYFEERQILSRNYDLKKQNKTESTLIMEYHFQFGILFHFP